ncbi:hypothetical protein CTAYLR_007816 [Chrysophaeum taylorii]|uniref:Uncharacterized protein n=1 Tax=Chrysophaeum taylorii TaxID=2483200 RepID=A0AAD7UJU0_9STRA|nr:hypothetical protein CTAYLR_007816 [Chrysophaeum taylorii]
MIRQLVLIAASAVALRVPGPGRLQRLIFRKKTIAEPLTTAGTNETAVLVLPELANATTVTTLPEIQQNTTASLEQFSKFDEFLFEWGLKEDPRIPEECRVAPIDRIKSSGRAGVAAYALTEGAFWLSSVPLAVAAVAYTTGSLPDVSTLEGKEQIAGYVFAFTTFARTIVPLRIALALALAPWCDRNIIQKFFPAVPPSDDCELPEE